MVGGTKVMARRICSVYKEDYCVDKWQSIDTALWVYFALPVLLFLFGFFNPLIGFFAVILTVAAAVYWLPVRSCVQPGFSISDCVSITAIACLAAIWTVLSGIGHFFYANTFDWVPRLAVFHDLIVQSWPPRYINAEGQELILRAPVGYYLFPAWIATFFGIEWFDRILLIWTWLGVTLFLSANLRGSLFQRLAGAVLFALASGLDFIGILHMAGTLPWLGGHIEWWAGYFQYSSNTTLLFWVPNHALPGWIAAAWLWRFRDDSSFVAKLPILFLPVMLWSPLPAIGLLPLAMAVAYVHWRRKRFLWGGFYKSLGLVLVPAGLIALYLLMSAGGIKAGLTSEVRGASVVPSGFDIERVVLFFLLEAGLLGIFALQRDRSPLMIAGMLVLFALPFVHFGPNNDLAMRGSVPALTILWLVLIYELTAKSSLRTLSPVMRHTLIVLFLVGMVTPFQEIYRSIHKKPWQPDVTLSADQALRGYPSHYFSRTDGSVLRFIFRN